MIFTGHAQKINYFTIGIESPLSASSSFNYFKLKTPDDLSYSGTGTVVYPLNNLKPSSLQIAYNLQLSKRFVWSIGVGQQSTKSYMYTINKDYYYSNDPLYFSDSLQIKLNRTVLFTGIKGYFQVAPLNLYLFANVRAIHAPFEVQRKTTAFTTSVYHEHRTFYKDRSLYWNYDFGIGAQRFIADNFSLDYGIKVNLGHYFFEKHSSDRNYYETNKLLSGEAPKFPINNVKDVEKRVNLESTMFVYLNIGINKN